MVGLRHMVRLVLCLLTASCGDAVVNDSVTVLQGETPDYVTDEESVEPLLDLEQVGAAIDDAIAVAMSLDPGPIHEAYQQVLGESDTECPTYVEDYYEDYGQWYWVDTCNTDSGTSFAGLGVSYDRDATEDGNYLYHGYSYFSGDARLVSRDGNIWSGSGYTSYYEREDVSNGYWAFYHALVGEFSWDGDSATGTWLEDELSASISIYASAYPAVEGGWPATDGTYVDIEGSVAGFEGEVNAIDFSDVLLYTEDIGSPCSAEPSGRISVRDDEGSWYEVEFQGAPYWGATIFPPACDGCGEVYYRGIYQGETCPGFAGLTEWLASPW